MHDEFDAPGVARQGRLADDAVLVRNAIANVWPRHPKPLWAAVVEVLATSSTNAHGLCRRFGFNPDVKVGGHVPRIMPDRTRCTTVGALGNRSIHAVWMDALDLVDPADRQRWLAEITARHPGVAEKLRGE